MQRSGPEPGGRLHSGCCSGRGGREVPKGLTGTRGEVGQPEDPQGGHSKRCGCAPGVKLSWGGTPHQGGVVPGAMGPWQRVPCAPQPACLGSEGSRQGLHTGSRHQLFPLSIGTAPQEHQRQGCQPEPTPCPRGSSSGGRALWGAGGGSDPHCSWLTGAHRVRCQGVIRSRNPRLGPPAWERPDLDRPGSTLREPRTQNRAEVSGTALSAPPEAPCPTWKF